MNSVFFTDVADAVLGLVAGLTVGAWHFVSLRWNGRFFAAGRAVSAFGLQLARLTLTSVALFALARIGAFSLVAGMAGFLLARRVALCSAVTGDGDRR